MNSRRSSPIDASEEIPALIEALLATEQRLEELTGGEVDTVASRDGRTFLLRRAQEQLRYSEAARQAASLNELRALFDMVPALIWLKDTQDRILRVNQRVADMAGKSIEEIEGKPSSENFPNEAARHYAEDQEVIHSGVPKMGMVEKLSGSKGQELWVQTDKVPVLDKDGKVTGLVVMAQDISGRIRDDAAIRQTGEQVLNAAEARSEHAESANLAKSQFLARMSHELRTPMIGILGMTTFLLDSELSDAQRHQAESISSCGESLLSILNDLLDFSKIEAGMLDFEMLDFILREVVGGCVELFALRAQGKGLELACHVESNVPAVLRGDPERLRQVLNNLIGNAIKFTARGKVAVRISLENQTVADALLRFEVKDTGIGIPTDVQGRLFQAFSQADTSTSRKYGGTGLGLAISRQLVEIMRGQIGILSAPGLGTTFWFTARLGWQPENANLALAPAENNRQTQKKFLSAASAVPPKMNLRILLAEDNVVNQEVAQGLLGKLGYRADVVANGNEALKALQNPYDVILMDCQMPYLDGYEATRRIRSFEQAHVAPFDRKTPLHIIAMTANTMKGDREKCFKAGMNDYLSKPVRLEDLWVALGRSSADEAFTGPPKPAALAGAPPDSEKPAETPLVDFDRLRYVNDDDPERICRLVNIYLTQTLRLVGELEAELEKNSPVGVAEAAHKLAGSSISCGVQAFTQPLRKLEQLGQAGNLSAAAPLFEQVRQAFPRVQDALHQFLASL